MATSNKEGKNLKPNKESMEERIEIAESEEVDMEKQVKQLLAWIDMIEGMDISELKQYVKNRPKSLKITKRDKNGIGERSRSMSRGVKNGKKSKNNGIMASVWKFHKEDDDNAC